ncbi:MAG TPA: hypothetical protein VG713_14390 [Pirellulales bacterium]|nr:hypothetical protein [Pirellulales bacterium]
MKDCFVEELVQQYGTLYGPQLTLLEAAEIAKASLKTIYDWSSRGLLDGFKSGKGRGALLARDAFVRFVATR